MKSLHVGNIANMAYGYCDILNSGKDDCLNYDLNHPCSLPENAIRSTIAIPYWYTFIKSTESLSKVDVNSQSDWVNFLNDDFGLSFIPSASSMLENNLYIERALAIYLKNYELLFGYSYAAIPLMIHAEKPFIPVEIGNLRDINYKNDPFSQLFLKTCLTAPHVIITNPDVKESAEKAGIKSFSFIPHPVDEKLWKKKCKLFLPSYIKEIRNSCDYLLIAPARHDYVDKGNDKVLKAFNKFLKIHGKSKLILINWGIHVKQSKEYIEENGLNNHVIWLDLLPESELINILSVCDILLDQFGIPKTFGLLTAKAMAIGIPVISKYEHSVNEWAFPEKPPIIKSSHEDEIFVHLKHIVTNKRFLSERQKESILWVEKYHSCDVVRRKFSDVKEIIINKKGNYETFERLKLAKQKFNKIHMVKKDVALLKEKYLRTIRWKILQKLSEKFTDLSPKELLEIVEQ